MFISQDQSDEVMGTLSEGETLMPDYDVTGGGDLGGGNGSDAGFLTDANLPGDSQGETNGMYAGVTRNTMSDGYSYLAANPGTRTDFLSSFRGIIEAAGGAVRSVGNQLSQTRQATARNAYLQRQGYRPTLAEQWAALSPFEQIGFVSAVVGILYFLAKKT